MEPAFSFYAATAMYIPSLTACLQFNIARFGIHATQITGYPATYGTDDDETFCNQDCWLVQSEENDIRRL
jgi:hypothetical protein